jgi:hypothetical protein
MCFHRHRLKKSKQLFKESRHFKSKQKVESWSAVVLQKFSTEKQNFFKIIHKSHHNRKRFLKK